MIVKELCAEGFRNLAPTVLLPAPGVNIFYGDNAQGKTNLLEALWLFTGGRSFRGARDSECVAIGGDAARLKMTFDAAGREQEATVTIEKRRSVTLNGIPRPSAASLAGVLCGVVFSPAHLSLVKDGPDGRRRFVDAACCQIRPAYMATVADYSRTVTQRNALLKNYHETPDADALLDAWDERLAVLGARIIQGRDLYLQMLTPHLTEIFGGLSGGKETLSLGWTAGENGEPLMLSSVEEAEAWLRTELKTARHRDIAAGISTVGPHRADLAIGINGMSARAYGSQGQQRSVVLALKLAEAAVLHKERGERPIALLDDVMSELDEFRQEYILNHIRDWQVFITCCDPANIRQLAGGAVFHMQNGTLEKENPHG